MITYLTDTQKSYLEDKDREDICACVCDFETGNHLLGRPRSLSHMALMMYLGKLSEREPENDIEEEIKMYFEACTDKYLMDEYEKKYSIINKF